MASALGGAELDGRLFWPHEGLAGEMPAVPAMGSRVFVGNLSWQATPEALQEVMSRAGEVTYVDILRNTATGKSKGCALVTFASPEGAAVAIAQLQDVHVDGRPINLREDREGGKVLAANAPADNASVFVANLSWQTTWQGLKDAMRQVGEVSHVDVLQDPKTGRSKGCGIVTFASPALAQQAIATLQGFSIDGRPIELRADRKSGPPGQARGSGTGGGNLGGGVDAPSNPSCVFVGNLSWETTADDLLPVLQQAGSVVTAEVLYMRSGRSKGYALAEYSSPAEAAHAIQTLTDTELQGRRIWLREDRGARR